jgi:16S rRNA (guanine966-N2)-methyltransferase
MPLAGRTGHRLADGAGRACHDGRVHGQPVRRYLAAVRVVSGSAGGRRLIAPDGNDTRPTTDRVREAMFNSLVSYDAVQGAVVLDLFAGSGALGIEALSRGASRAVFVERDARARSVVEANLETTGLAGQAQVVGGSAEDHVRRTPDVYDLVLADPPYDYADWPDLLGLLGSRLRDDAVVVIESGDAVELPDGWVVERAKSYGGTLVSFVHPPTTPPPTILPEQH